MTKDTLDTFNIYTMEGSPPLFTGTEVSSFTLKGAGVSIPAITVGERGRGRQLGVLPVRLTPEQYREWEEKGSVKITAASVGETRAGKPKLFASPDKATSVDYILCILRTKIGYRGGNDHLGDMNSEWWTIEDTWFINVAKKRGIPIKDRYTFDEMKNYSSPPDVYFHSEDWEREIIEFERHCDFKPFPGKILTRGVIAQGGAGRMGSGDQIISLIPKDTVWRTRYYGRLYGAANHHYHIWNGDKLISATREERELADLF